MTSRRLIETAFPLKQASLDSVHEKSVRHGHISTLYIWPARRPLAASRAALLATLLRDPVGAEARPADPARAKARQELLRRMAGRVVDKLDRDGESAAFAIAASAVVEAPEKGLTCDNTGCRRWRHIV